MKRLSQNSFALKQLVKKGYDTMTNQNHQLVQFTNNRLVTTSLLIAQNFGKKHKNILQAIHELDCSKEFGELNFQPTTYISNQNKELPMYEITRDGFTFLCMGFTGAQAAYWKERYIAAFNSMEQHIIQSHTQLETLKAAYLKSNPELAKLLAYMEKGLNHEEIGKLLDVSSTSVRDRLKKLAALGFVDYRPNPRAVSAGRKGMAAMRLAQQSLDLEV